MAELPTDGLAQAELPLEPKPGARLGGGGRDRGKAARRVGLALALGALLVLWGFTAAGLAGEPRNSIAMDDERGLRQLALDLQAEGVRVEALGVGPHALDAFEDPPRTVFLVAGVARAYSPGEVQALLAFVERGGSAVIADDFGFADDVGRAFGVNFDKRVLRDNTSYRVNASIVLVNATVAGHNTTFYTNVPSTLGVGVGVVHEVRAESTGAAYIDANGNGFQDQGDVSGPLPIIVEVPRGQGRAVFVSDPGIFLNGLAKDNGPFLRGNASRAGFFRALLPEGGVVAVDESRHPLPPLAAGLAALLAGEVQATSEVPLALLVGASGAVLALLVYAGFQAPPDITAYASKLDTPIHRLGEAERRARLQRLALRVLAETSGLNAEALEKATPQQLAERARDPVVAALARGEPVKVEPEEALRRIQAAEPGRKVPEVKR